MVLLCSKQRRQAEVCVWCSFTSPCLYLWGMLLNEKKQNIPPIFPSLQPFSCISEHKMKTSALLFYSTAGWSTYAFQSAPAADTSRASLRETKACIELYNMPMLRFWHVSIFLPEYFAFASVIRPTTNSYSTLHSYHYIYYIGRSGRFGTKIEPSPRILRPSWFRSI